MMLTIDEAKAEFIELMEKMQSNDVEQLIAWVQENFSNSLLLNGRNGTNNSDQSVTYANRISGVSAVLEQISADIKRMDGVKQNAIFETENIKWPMSGLNSECDPKSTVHMDAFLYTDDEIDSLVCKGLFSRNYCSQCGSRDTKPLTFVTHSISISQLQYMFTKLYPLNAQWECHTILDVGSRLGCVLYAANLYSEGKVISVGIEINKELCDLQKKVVHKHNMDNTIHVINDDVRNQHDVVSTADVIVLHNVFNSFLTPSEQIECWNFLRSAIHPGAVIISIPSLADVADDLNLPFEMSDWTSKIETDHLAAQFAGSDYNLYEDCRMLNLYSVRSAQI